jgi:hypothetical protein
MDRSMHDDLAELEQRKLDALSKQDAREYARCIIRLGQDPEYQDLYNDGMALIEQDDIAELKEKHNVFVRTLAREIPNNVYRKFLDETKERKINVPNLFADTVQKRSLLFKHFHNDFAPDKPRDLRFRGPMAVGTMFKGVFDYAKKRMKEQREIMKSGTGF